ncbi:MAG: sensor histidine kinase [Pseudomonadota bacterium]
MLIAGLFWAVVVLVNLGPDWQRFATAREALEVIGLTTVLQMAVAAVTIAYLVPRWLDKGATGRFLLLLLLAVLCAAEVNILVSYFYLEPTHTEGYGARYQEILGDLTLVERLGFSWVSRYILLSKLPHLVLPAAVLIAVRYYRRQQSLLQLREQQQAAELNALKSQLNPHFIFNTLNNIYALALKRSTLTAEAVARLSSILDYVLYRGSERVVSLRDEVAMIEAYIALEQLRFGDRLTVHFSQHASPDHQVPPLLFLTLLENAFKHGVATSLDAAVIEISLVEEAGALRFAISNSRPPASAPARRDAGEQAIGLRNLQRQLALQCPDTHELTLVDGDDRYTATLTLTDTCPIDTAA